MPYQIGRVFSDAVYNSIERGRDRALQDGGPRITRESSRTRAPADFERARMEAQMQGRELDFARTEADRDFQLAVERNTTDRQQAIRTGDLAEAKRLQGEEEALYKRGLGERKFGLDTAVKEDQARDRMEGRAQGQQRLDIDAGKAAFDKKKWEAERQAAEDAAEIENVTSEGEALKTLRTLYGKGAFIDKDSGKPNPARAEAYARMILQAARFAVDQKGLSPRILEEAQGFVRALLAGTGVGTAESVGAAPENAALDLALGAEPTGGAGAPRLGGR